MSAEARLAALKILLPSVPKPVAAYVPAVRTGKLLFLAGMIPTEGGELRWAGKVGGDLSIEEGYQAARLCALNALAVIRDQAGSLDAVARIVRVTVYVVSAEGFTQQPKVANGASELFLSIFGDAGRHARVAVGTNELPLGAPVEVEVVLELKGEGSEGGVPPSII